MSRVLFIFLDGVGIGLPDPDINPFFQAHLPSFRLLLGGDLPHLESPELVGETTVAFPLDATLGVEGLPQSGTGQTALLTGRNGPAIYGRHFGPWVPVRLRPLVERESFLARAVASGAKCAFANAYPKEFEATRWARYPAGPPLAAQGAGLMTRQAEALASGDALSSEIVNTPWRSHLGSSRIPAITPWKAGENLARITSKHHLTFFAHYATDHAGHRGKMPGAVESLELVDEFLAGTLAAIPPDTLLIISSDHGNVEDVTGGHTRNPTLAILSGPGAARYREDLRDTTDLSSLVLRVLSAD